MLQEMLSVGFRKCFIFLSVCFYVNLVCLKHILSGHDGETEKGDDIQKKVYDRVKMNKYYNNFERKSADLCFVPLYISF